MESEMKRTRTIKITRSKLDEMIKDELENFYNEHRGKSMKDLGVKGQQIARKRDEENRENTKIEKEKKDAILPGKRELDSLGRGVISEDDYEVQEDGWIKIKKDALDRLLGDVIEEQATGDLQRTCNKAGFRSLEQFLRLQDAFTDAKKGTFGDKKK
jgi:hypothetical protein